MKENYKAVKELQEVISQCHFTKNEIEKALQSRYYHPPLDPGAEAALVAAHQ